MDTCFESWVSRKIVSPAASLRCSSKRYPGTPTLSVPCDSIVECADGIDEVSCQKQSLSTYLLAGSIGFVVLFYILLKCGRKHNQRSYDSNEDEEDIFPTRSNLFESIRESKVTKINTYLFNAVHSMKIEESEQVCKEFYDMITNIHGNDEAKAYLSLHKLLDPAMAAAVDNAKNPGLTEKFLKMLDKCSCGGVSWLRNKIIKNRYISGLIASMVTIIRIISNFTDMFKDIFLTVSLIVILGGPLEVLRYPTQFTSVIVMTLLASILIPLLTSSLHLALHNPNMIYHFTGVRRSVVILHHLACCFILPLLLINRYESAKEKIRSITKKNSRDSRIPFMIHSCRKIKTELVEFLKIELGAYE